MTRNRPRSGSLPSPEDNWQIITAARSRRRNLASRLAESIRSATPETASSAAQDLLGQLSPKDRELVTLIIWDGFGVGEAGQILGLSPSTARSRYSRAKEKLRAAHQSQDPPQTTSHKAAASRV
ncbi:RNA polymerase sigma factor [Arthrobacter psychrolactophilus]